MNIMFIKRTLAGSATNAEPHQAKPFWSLSVVRLRSPTRAEMQKKA
ncbi:MAG: hypothetical protein ACK40K_05130 [Raineya sp.]